MSQTNLGSLRTRTRRWLKEENPDTSYWDNNFLDQIINSVYRRRCAQLIMAFEGAFVHVATRDLTADKDRYGWPDNFLRGQKLELVR
ncbi:MAG: hypothetical protein ACXABY_32440, partial [Candidatus Thorarchaeota archaeon]